VGGRYVAPINLLELTAMRNLTLRGLAIAVLWSTMGSLTGAELTRAWTIAGSASAQSNPANPRCVSYIRGRISPA